MIMKVPYHKLNIGIVIVLFSLQIGVAQHTEGKTKIDVVYEISCSGNNLYIAKSDNQFALMNMDWKALTAFKYDKIDLLDQNVLYAVKDNRTSLFNCSGIQITNRAYKRIKTFSDNELKGRYFVINAKDKIGMINEKGELLLPVEFDLIDPMSIHKYLYAEKDGRKYYFDYNGAKLDF